MIWLMSKFWRPSWGLSPYRRQATVRYGLFALILTAGCVNLKPVADFGSHASAVAGYPDVAKDYPLILTRESLYGDKGAAVSKEAIAQREQDAKRLADAQTLLQAYAKALGALASDDVISYDTQVDALNKSIVDGKFATSAETAKYAGAAKLGLRLFTDLYRRAKIKKIVLTYNPSVQKAVVQLRQVLDGYIQSISDEQADYALTVAGPAFKATRQFEGLPFFVRVASEEHKELLAQKQANAESLSKGIQTFGEAHQKMADDFRHADFRESLVVAQDYATRLQGVLNSFDH